MPRLSTKTEVVSMTDTDQFAIIQGGNVRLIDRANTGLAESADVDTALAAKASAADLTSHSGNTANPHAVSKTRVGLSAVDNTSDAAKPVSTATQSALNLKADSTALTAHTGAVDNPHAVTKAQVGLTNVQDT